MSSTFDGLYIARSGVHASRVCLDITGQNITNAAREGYTRQRVDLSSIPPCSYGSLWATPGAVSGNGVSADGTEQLRDQFLDGEFRTQNAKAGETTTQINAMYDMEDIFSTTTTASSSSKSSVIDVLSDAYSKLVSQLQDLTSGKSDATESSIREQATILATKLNTAAKALNTVREKQTSSLQDYGIKQANDLMKNIANLNDRIRDAEIGGQPALELKDQRNLLLDKLSQYTSIQVIHQQEDVGAGHQVDTVSVCLADKDGNALKGVGGKPLYTLINNKQYAQFSAKADRKNEDDTDSTKSFDTTHIRLSGLTKLNADGSIYNEDGSVTFSPADAGMKNTDLKTGSFAGYLKLLNESGEYDTAAGSPTTTSRGIGFYSQMLDGLAQKLAETINAVNSTNKTAGEAATASNIKPFFTGSVELPSGVTAAVALKQITDGITAENIHLSAAWGENVSNYLTKAKEPVNPTDSNSGSFSNIITMIGKMDDSPVDIKSSNEVSVFSGSLRKAFASVSTMLGQDANSVQSTDNTNAYLLNNIDTSRQEVSSVSLDDEAVSISQFTQSLNASSRFMTAVDECLQTIINNMGTAGRG